MQAFIASHIYISYDYILYETMTCGYILLQSGYLSVKIKSILHSLILCTLCGILLTSPGKYHTDGVVHSQNP